MVAIGEEIRICLEGLEIWACSLSLDSDKILDELSICVSLATSNFSCSSLISVSPVSAFLVILAFHASATLSKSPMTFLIWYVIKAF